MGSKYIQSNSEAVREFTSGAGQPCPDFPEPMNESEVDFIGKMILDEVMELFAVMYTPEVAKAKLKGFIDSSKDLPKEDYSKLSATDANIQKIADQADALTDVYYYSQNAMCKKGVNMSALFDLVHAANMAKRDPATGQYSFFRVVDIKFTF
jgi:predicted HAD superfamily Cof-like phosphohydrolase